MPRRSDLGYVERFARWATEWTGSSGAFALAALAVLAWAATGPYYGYSDTWQLVVNSGTSIVTFLMVFLIQQSQNKDALAVHLKLNEVIAATPGASNRLINIEDLSEQEIRILRRYFDRLVELAQRDEEIRASHSVEEAAFHHTAKQRQRGQA
jgi:low affinity Fe/Cu permease